MKKEELSSVTGTKTAAVLSLRSLIGKITKPIKRITEEKLNAEREARELIQKKEQAEETLRIKTAFLANISHEIRTPMYGIIGFSDLALDDNISLNARNYITKIKTSAESLLQIINDILDISKIEAGKVEIEKTPFDISEVIEFCRLVISPKANEKDLKLYCYVEPPEDRLLLGDPAKLRQILFNLLSNAVKFTNTGTIKLLSAVTNKTEDSVTIHFEVKDSGIGMTKEQIDSIFLSFVNADDSTKRKFSGTGLGLTITRIFLELMGSKLKIESTIGLGSIFSFELTFETRKLAASDTGQDTTADTEEKPIFEGEVLVCEDNILNQQVTCDYLSKVGLRAIVAANGRSGVDIVKSRMKKNEKPFVLILMDIYMPEMDGLEAAKRIIDAGCTTPIIALTANAMFNDREAYLSMGIQDCMQKPFVAKELWSCLLKYLKPVGTEPRKKNIVNVEEEEKHRMEMIKTFITRNKTTFGNIKKVLEEGNIKLAHRLVHTLKGAASTIGMTMLADAAFAIEQSLSEGETENLHEKMNTLEHELSAALNELIPIANDYYRSRDQDKTSEKNFDDQKALNFLTTLDSLLESCSFDSLNLVNDLKKIPGTEQLAEQIENIKFKQARETLAGIKKQLAESNNER
jgi:signal transduction histidine kinase/CheY-like chemotaxis protein